MSSEICNEYKEYKLLHQNSYRVIRSHQQFDVHGKTIGPREK